MRVSGLKGVASAIHDLRSPPAASTTVSGRSDFTKVPEGPRGLDLADAFLIASGSPGTSQPEERDVAQQLVERQTCASGLVFYACGNGFRGCCATNACNGDDGCPASALSISTTAATKAVTVQNSRTSTSISFATVTTIDGRSTGTTTTTRTATSVVVGSPLQTSRSSESSSSSSSPTATSSATTSASPMSTTNTQPLTRNRNNVGAIAGGVVGGVAGLLLILALIAFLTRRQRRKVDERRARREREEEMKKITPSPGATFNDHLSAHHRSRSTANDVYTPNSFGGSTISPPSTAHLSPPPSTAATADLSELEGHSSMPPGGRAERGRGAIPAAVLRPPQMLDGTPVTATMPKRPSSLGSTSRSSAFREHISEMEDTSQPPSRPTTSRQISSPLESPILGRSPGQSTTSPSLADETRRKQHLMSWNNYDESQATEETGMMSATIGTPKTPPSARKDAATSPPQGDALPTLLPTRYEPEKAKEKEVKRGWSLRRGRGG